MSLFLLIVFHGLSIGYCSHLLGFNLYHTHHLLNGDDHDCLYYFTPEMRWSYQFIQYCIRSPLVEEVFDEMNNTNSFTFEDLRQKNITSDQLYEWSAPIDLIEHYQNYLENNASTNNLSFYNCTYPWFGSRCEYCFDKPQLYFSEQIGVRFSDKLLFWAMRPNNLSCYTYLQCDRVGDRGQTPSACLDWREVCDGKVDCIDGGSDEELCWQLEINDCDNNTEFRCGNGLCIPLAFLRDDAVNADCLDRSDEPKMSIKYSEWDTPYRGYVFPSFCLLDPAFRCEDHMSHPSENNKYQLECGDGSSSDFSVQCINRRITILIDALWLGTNVSDNCRRFFGRFIGLMAIKSFDEPDPGPSYRYANYTERYCPKLIEFPPMLFGHVRFIYTNNQIEKLNVLMHSYIVPDYICYDGKLCGDNLFSTVLRPPIDLFGNNSTCRSLNEFAYQNITFIKWGDVMNYFYDLFRKCSTYRQPLSSLDNSNLYQCINSSKIISQHRLVDGIEDCLYGDDESYKESCSLRNFNHRFKCDQGENTKCLARSRVSDRQKDCLDGSDEPEKAQQSAETEIAFQTLCDGYTELPFSIMIDGQNETDETECMHFSCNNTYTRCDGFWNCPNGADEINCEWPPMCPPLYHMCLSPISGDLTCLHIEHANDGVVDCLGASDERQNCRDLDKSATSLRYQCWNSSTCIPSDFVCYEDVGCPIDANTSILFCQTLQDLGSFGCQDKKNLTHAQQLTCTLTDYGKMTTVHFSLIGLTSYEFLKKPDEYSPRTTAVIADAEINDDFFADDFSIAVYCNRGLMVRRSIDNENNTEAVCLCPPAYYGHLCQFQNQRVSLTMQIRASFDVRLLFAIIITLRDDQQNLIESHDQITYLYERDCLKKFNIYLLYATRPKNTSTNYSVHIDILNKETLEYRASYLYPIKFSFLPVYRLAVRLHIPPTEIITQNCETLNCGMHGRCSQYVNTKTVFCLCHKGWSGLHCDLPHPCHHCSSDSFCFGSNICVCPLEKFGPRCYLKHSTCSCMNNGTCISSDERVDEKKAPWCRCPERFSGPKCETLETTITLSFAPKIPIPSSIHVHFIEVFGKHQSHIRSTTLKKIPVDQESVTISRSVPFHLVFIEIEQSKRYYLSIIQQAFVPSANISTTLKHSDHCPSINDLLNETILSGHPLRRMKYYHIPCQERIDLTCFHDEKHLCICNQDLRQANCLTFNHNQSYDCEEQNPCENQGQCFRDSPSCPVTFMCICDDCSYGSRCQFSTKGFGLSLDVILGYHIQPNLSLKEQRVLIHVTTVVITLMLILGLVGGIPSIFTFQIKKLREVGCGYYLLASSYTSVITIMMFALKFYFLLVSQMGMITNHHYVTFNCIFFEFLLKVLLSTSDWLNAFVGIERAITVVKDTKFNKMKSKRIAKWAIICICIVTITTHIHDPVYRRMIDDTEEHRTWCHVQFSPSVQLFNFIILGFHFILPFISNISSALIIIINTARQRSIAQKQQSYQHQLRKQFYKLKHLLISPIILILLALPRLIISSHSGCMKTTRGNPWLYLSGYLISYLPPMLLAVVFIWPSDTYKTEFKKTVTRIQRYLRRDHF